MTIEPVGTAKNRKAFYAICREVYKNNPLHRSTEEDITHLLVDGPSAFHDHAVVKPHLILKNSHIAGRFAFIQDQKLPDYVQVAFFEALPGLPGVTDVIIEQARKQFPACRKIVFGLNGHLNYGAGILLNKFNLPPVFGLPYNPDYYHAYFSDLIERSMVSFRFPIEPFVKYHKELSGQTVRHGITIRKMNKKRLHHEIKIYTALNNACFPGHPYWADRNVGEDFELFHPFHFLIKEEHLLFAEKDGQPIGFFLWYPDFNQLAKNNQRLGIRHVLRYYMTNAINTFRFTEIAVLPKYNLRHAAQAMILYAIPHIQKAGLSYGEGGFIFEENVRSISMTRRFLERATGEKMAPFRRYAVFEQEL